MKINKNIFICALLVLMLLVCINAASADSTLDANLTAEDSGEIAIDESSSEVLSASGDTYVVDVNGGGQYTSISAAVSAATGGETILVKNGEYSEANTITFSKSVNVVGESQDGVKITGAAKTLFGATTDEALTLSFTNLTILNAGSGSNAALKLTYCAHDVTLTNCTFDNCGSKYGTMQLGHPGTAIIDNCKILNSKETTSAGSGAIYVSGKGQFTIKNSIIDNVTYAVSSSYMNGVIYVYAAEAIVNIENTTISNVIAPTRGVINTVGTVNIKGSKIQDNTLNQFSDSMTSHVIYIGDKGSVNIEQTEISDNTCGSQLFNNYKDTSKLTVNYCNIHDNAASGTVNSLGTIDLEANYWGSNDKPADVAATTWVVENNGEYTLNTGEALAKDIPGLTGGDEPQPAAYDFYVSPDGDGDGSSYDTPTTLDNIFMNMLVPEGGSVFLLNGDYTIMQAWIIGQSMSLVGESRDGVILNADNGGFLIGDPMEVTNNAYFVDSVSISKMTIESFGSEFLHVSASMTELNITDCVITSNGFVKVGYNVMDELLSDSTGTLNFKKNILSSDQAISVTGQWNANINNNIFLNSNSGANVIIIEDGEGAIDNEYNYWGSNVPATDCTNYIIINVKSNASEIYTDESAKITVEATLDDKNTNAASYLPDYPIEVSLVAAGTLSQRDLELSNGIAQATYTSDVARNDNIRAIVLGQTLTVPITVKERYTGIIYVNTTGSDDNVGSIDAPVATVAKAVELALANGGSGEIIINEGTYVGNGFHVTGDLTVTGNGKVTLDANNEGRFFYMNYGDAANKIELSNLILTNSKGYGAAVYSFANELILDNVTIVDTQADGYLISSRGKLTIKDSEISNSMSGDVIQQNSNGDILINNTTFKDNSIMDSTSVYAVINLNSYSGNLVIENSKFINNTARQGVIKGNYNYNIDVKGTEFINNTNAASYGGAIYTTGGTLDITDSVFVNNKAARSGGAIYVGYRSTATIDKSIFINNTANTMNDEYYGDAIYDGNKLTVNNSVLLTNSNNGLIYSDGEDNVPYAQNCWWGTNDDPSSLNGVGYYEDDDWEEYDCPPVDVSNWVTMDASFAPADAQAGDEVTVTATFSNANLPDGINVTFTSTSGLNTVVSTVDAQASTTYTIDANDEAIVATSTNAVVEMPLAVNPFTTNIVTNDTFYNFFDESGMLRDTVPYDELIFQGVFSDLAAGYVIITKPVTITGDEAVLNDMGIMIASEDVALDNMTLIATTSLGSLITVTESNVDLTNLIISYIVDDDEAIAIDVRSTDTISDVNILNNSIYFESHVSDDEGYATAINLEDVEDVIVDNNTISASVPALFVETYDYSYFMMGLVYVNPIRIYEASGLEFTNNNVDVTINDCTASYPTAQAIYLVGSEDVLIKGNNFTMIDTATPLGTSIYLYAVECGFSEDISFIENNFNISTTGGKSGAGSAYALQVATSEVTITGNNITCDSNGPNLGIFSPYGFGVAKDMDIENNFINITGYAAGSNEFALISGIEIQTGYATIYNNTIYVQNKGEYADNYPVSGISAVQYSASTLTFDIKDNEVYTNGKYAVDMLYPPQSAVVVGNTLYANELTGDDAVYIKSGDNNEIHDNLPAKELTNIVTNDTFYNFFDEWGMLLDTIEFDELIFQGEFSDLVDTIIIADEITLTGDNAVLNNIALSIIGDDVSVTGFTLNENNADFTTNGGAAIFVSGSDVTLDNVSVTYVAPSEVEAIAVFANGADNFALINSEIIFTGVNPGSNHNRGLEVRNSDEALIDNNTISAVLPAVPVSWGGEGIGQDLVLAVGIQGGDDVEFTNNRVTVNTNGAVGSYPTIDAVMVHSANDILIKGNNITHIDTTTEDGARYYYSLDIYNTTGTVEANDIIVNTTAGVDRAGTAYPIQLTGPFTVTVKNNNLTAISKGPIAGIYASNWPGAATLIVKDNTIDVNGYATTGNYALVAGIEAEIDMLKVYNNTITVKNGADYDDANQVIGVGIGSSYFYGDASADIKDNNITVDGKYAVYYAKAVNTNVTGNTLYGHELTGDEAVFIQSGDNNVVGDNIPIKPYEGIIYVNATGSDDNNGSIEAPVATIAKAVELALGKSGQIIVNEGTYDVPQVTINDDLNITANGDVLFKAQDATKKAFVITAGDVSISGVTFTNFNATYNGAVIRVDAGSLAIDNSKFIKNGGENQQALIQVKNADLNLTNTVFDHNTARNGNAYGTVYVSAGTLYVDNCNFTDNFNKYGALYIASSIATIYNSSFIGHNATSASGGFGAGIYASGTATYISSYSGNLMNGSASYILVQGCSFINNTAKGANLYAGQGGAIAINKNVTMFINDCLFENNTCTDNTGSSYESSKGGAIYVSAGNVQINKSIFKNNGATEGPEIYMKYDNNSILHPEELNILNITNSIILNDNVAIVATSSNGTYVANDNWWGAKDNVTDKVSNVVVDSWAKMNASFTPADAYVGDNVTVTAVFDNVNLPDGINVTFTSTSGNLSTVVATKDAQASTNYTIVAGDESITATSTDAVVEIPIIQPSAEITITADSVWIGSNGTISVSVPNATGTVTIEINGKSYPLELDNGTATKEIPAEDLLTGENAIAVTYEGPEFATTTATGVLFVANGVVTQDTYMYYFNQEDSGKFYDYIPEGATLDFQGSIINPDQSVKIWFNVNKPVNIITSTNDAYIDLNTTAGSLTGENPGNRFTVGYGGSGSNITGLNFHNTQLWIANTHNVVLDNISNVIEDQRVGSGVGATSVRENCTYVTVKNSYFYTRNNGGSSSLVMAWADYCTFDNNTIVVEGNVGNMIYLTTFNVNVPSGVVANVHNNITNNHIYSPNSASAICWALVLSGSDNLIENNTVEYKGVGITTQFGSSASPNNTYRGNVLLNGSSMSVLPDSIVYNNTVSGALTVGARSVAYNNTVGGKLNVAEGATAYDNTIMSGFTTTGTNSVVENNTFVGAVTINKVGTTFVGNNVTGTVTVSSNNNVIKGNNITSTGDYAIDLGSKTGNNVTDNYLISTSHKGDGAVRFTNANNIVENNIPTIDVNVAAESVWIGANSTVTVSIPNATGNVTIKVNDKEYSAELDENGTAAKVIPAEDLALGENNVTVSYNSDVYGLKKNSTTIVVIDGVVTQDTYLYYFNQDDNGKLFDYVPEGATLDFQGSIINPDQANVVQMNVNKPVNIISTTEDAYVDLNTTAGSLLGESPGNSFAVTRGGSGSNVTGIYFHNTQLWISNTTNVVLDNISVVVEDQRVGSGVGATTIRDNSTNVILKNSYLYTRNNGGSTTFTMSWATNCTIDNCTVKAEGNVGNLIYLNIFNIAGAPTGIPLNNNNTVSNNKIYGKEGSSISVGLMVEGQNNTIVNNTLYKSSISTSFGGVNPANNTYVGNTMTEGAGLTAQAYSIVYNNNVTGALSTGKGSVAYNNTVGGKLTVGQDAIAYNNTVGNGAATGGTNAVIENNTITGAVTINKVGTIFVGNDVAGTVTVSANNNVIENNTIISTGAYAVDLGAKTGNNVTGNYLVAKEKYGQGAVKSTNANNVIEDNRPYDPELVVSVEDITVGEDAIIKITVNENATGTVVVIVDGRTLTVDNIVNGTGNVTVSGLAASDYTVVATFTSTCTEYGGSENSTVFTVAKLESEINITVSDAELGNNATIAVSIPGATGNVTVIVNGKEEQIPLDENGNATYAIDDIAADDYNVVVIYPGDKDHAFAYATESFTVDKLASEVNVTVTPAKAGDKSVISVNVTDGATGTVVIDVAGTKYAIDLADGNELEIALDAGNYTVSAAYSGDDSYNASVSKEETIVVEDKAPANIVIEVPDDAKVGETITINITADTDVKLAVLINGEAQTIPNGPTGMSMNNILKAGNSIQLTYTVPKAGIYNVTVSAEETPDYAAQTVTKVFEATKKDAELNITPIADAQIGDKVNITVESETDGALTIKVNGETVTGEYEITKAGAYTVVVESAATDAYNKGFATYNFEVAEPTEYNITVVVDGKEYNATVVNGTATVDTDMPEVIKNLTDELDEAKANATSLAEELADANAKVDNLTAELADANAKVDNLTAELADANAKVDNLTAELADANAKVDNLTGELADANAKVDNLTAELADANAKVDNLTADLADANAKVDNLTGELADANAKVDNLTKELEDALARIPKSAVVDGVEYPIEYVNGTATVTTNKTEPDNNITVIVDGKEYPAEVVNGTAVVNTDPIAPQPVAPSVNITAPSNVAAGEAPTVKVELPSDATGNVTVKVDGKEVANVPVENGTADIPLSALGGGSHAVEVAYTGDSKYAATTAVSVINAEKKATHIEIDATFTRVATDFNAGERGANQTGRLLDEDGNPVVNRTVQIAVNGVIYNKTTDENGTFYHQINLAAANTYTYALVFSGDELYNASLIASSKLTVTKKATSITASNKAFKAKAKTKTISVTLKTIKNPYDGKTYLKSGKKITLKVNGVTYTAKINAKGVAKFTIKLTKKGKYTATVKFAGDKTYKASSKKIKITIK